MARPRKENTTRNREWKDSTRNERTRSREQALSEKLLAAGWISKSAFLTAIINAVIEVPNNPSKDAARTGESAEKEECTMKGICIFERDERYTDNGQPALDWRPVRAILPAGSAPIAMVAEDGTIAQWEAQNFNMVEVAAYMSKLGIKSTMVEE